MTDPTRHEAARRLRAEREELLELLGRLPPRALTRSGLGGGAWSPKDLIGHLESWEEHALGALDAWSRDEPAPIDRALRSRGLTDVNRAEVHRKARRSTGAAFSSAERTHDRLLSAIVAISDRAWSAPATSRGRVALGRRLGRILAGTSDPFAHDSAHLNDVRTFVQEHGRPSA